MSVVLRLVVLVLLLATTAVHARPSYMCQANYCNTVVKDGQDIPRMGRMSFNAASARVISVSRGATVLSSGNHLV